MRVDGCRQCGVYYANPVASDLVSGRFYDRLGKDYYLTPDKLRSDYAAVRFARELRFFRRWCSQGAVLDVGCSTGGFLYRLNQFGGYRGEGMDVSGPALAQARSQGVAVIDGSFLDHDFGARKYRAVTFWAVLEHLADPLSFLRKAAGLLEPGGYCFVLVPNRKSLATRILGAKYRYVMPEHVNYFSRKTLIRFVERVPELQVVASVSTHFNPMVIWQDLWRREARVADADRARLLQRTTAWKQSRSLKLLRWPYALAEKCLGRLYLADNVAIVARKTDRDVAG